MMRRFMFVFVLIICSAGLINAAESEKVNVENKIKNYFRDVMIKVNNESNFAKKREILNSSLSKMDKALSTASSYINDEQEVSALAKTRSEIKNKIDELNGNNGLERIKDSELNNFSAYVMQDFESADTYLYVSVTTLLIIALLLILLL